MVSPPTHVGMPVTGATKSRRSAAAEPGASGEATVGNGATRGSIEEPDLPEQTVDDTDAGWGEAPRESGHEAWLQEQRPPHWN